MQLLTNEVTPQDPYQVKMNESIEMSHISFLIDLYQPIIGPEAISLYLTLRNHLSFQYRGTSLQHAHRQLANQINVSFHNIMKARRILEAVGLLRTKKYQHKNEDRCIILYLLKAPLEPIQFFQSDILSILLLNRIGKSSYQELLGQWLSVDVDIMNTSEYHDIEITKPFDEVFDSVLQSELMIQKGSEMDQLIQPISSNNPLSNDDEKVQIKGKYLDIDFMKGMVSNLFNIGQIFTKGNIELFHELAFLYQLSEMDLIHLLHDQSIYDSSGLLQEKLMRQRLREKLQYEQKEMIFIEREAKSHTQNPSVEIQEKHGDEKEKNIIGY
ncbi:hypothetical protein [Tepidibacillus marianensis]|uniref:hypothetical protein n=1 Tax=Tepidibacillus marianensis TaxID=3131995 RepID=UPI0030CEB456